MYDSLRGSSVAAADEGLAVSAPSCAAAAEVPRKQFYTVRVLKDGQLEERKVAVGIMNRLAAQVLSGLADGEEVVLDAAPEPKRDRKSAARRTAKL